MSDERTRIIEEMFMASADALIVVRADGRIEAASPAVRTVFGYDPGELVDQPVEVLIPVDVRGLHEGHRRSFARSPVGRPMGIGLDLQGLHRDGSVFPVDVSLVPSGVGDDLRVGAIVRDATDRRRSEDMLRFVNEISRGVIAGEPTQELLTRTAARARVLVGAAAAFVSMRSPSGQEMVVEAAEGEAAASLAGARVPVETSLAARAMRTAATVMIPDMTLEPDVLVEARQAGLGAGLYIPMQSEHGPIGTLVVARRHGAAPFGPNEVAAAEVFASAAAIVLALASARLALDELRISSEHERIARDLHDTVIQRLFGLGMRLQAAERMAEGAVAERIRSTVDAIDEVIREIRETIFDLNHPDREGTTLRSVARAVVAEAVEALGFRPRLAFRGPVEAAVPESLLVHIEAVLRESLSNVARHANASAVDVVVAVGEGRLTVSVADDGIGPSSEPAAGHGLSNMTARAAHLGGTMTISGRKPTGTLLKWTVPLGGAADGVAYGSNGHS